MYYCPILKTTVNKQMLRGIKHGGGEKTTIKLVYKNDNEWRNRSELRVVFHNDKVYFATVHCVEHWVKDSEFRGHLETFDYSKPIKSQHDFNMLIFGYDYRGEPLDELALVDLALKLYADSHLDTFEGRSYVVKH